MFNKQSFAAVLLLLAAILFFTVIEHSSMAAVHNKSKTENHIVNENKQINLEKQFVEQYVTPQMYGAKADGITDDTAAFQAAVNSGHDVYIPTSGSEIYRITDTITILNRNCKRIYSNGIWRGSSKYGCVIFDLGSRTDSTIERLKQTPLFKIGKVSQVHFYGLNFRSRPKDKQKLGCFLSAIDTTVDYDIKIDSINITNFNRIVEFKGRGFEARDCVFAVADYIGLFDWVDSDDTNRNHPAEYNQRAISFIGNRLHSVSTCFINVRSGHAYGLTFMNNIIDVGWGCLIEANDQAYNWIVSNNLVQGINVERPVIKFNDGMRNSIITNNIFSCDTEYWKNSKRLPTHWLLAGGTVEDCNITGNNFKNSQLSMIELQDMHHSVITGNIFQGVGNTKEQNKCACVKVNGKLFNSIINNNVLHTNNPHVKMVLENVGE